MKLIFATNNSHKLDEARQILRGSGVELLSLADIGCHDDIAETADTLEGNAIIKATYVASRYGHPCIADDTGLEVEALGGAPGVYSARFAGPECNSAANTALLLSRMEGVTDRRARFRTVIAYVADPAKPDSAVTLDGIVEGSILTAPDDGGQGFGYDPVFRPVGSDRSFASMTPDEKNSMSHRGRALRRLADYINNHLAQPAEITSLPNQ